MQRIAPLGNSILYIITDVVVGHSPRTTIGGRDGMLFLRIFSTFTVLLWGVVHAGVGFSTHECYYPELLMLILWPKHLVNGHNYIHDYPMFCYTEEIMFLTNLTLAQLRLVVV